MTRRRTKAPPAALTVEEPRGCAIEFVDLISTPPTHLLRLAAWLGVEEPIGGRRLLADAVLDALRAFRREQPGALPPGAPSGRWRP